MNKINLRYRPALVYTFTNLDTLANLNTHFQFPVHIHKYQQLEILLHILREESFIPDKACICENDICCYMVLFCKLFSLKLCNIAFQTAPC